MDTFKDFLCGVGFMPHGYCYQWNSSLLWLHMVSDALITASYYSIPLTLFYFVRKRADLEFSWMFLCFAIFIVACGTTHLMEMWTIWNPSYWLSGTIKAVTALASVPTALLLLTRVVPAAIKLPSPSQLRKANEDLQREILTRKAAEAELARSNRDLQNFAHVASHDLKEPLRMVSSYCGLLKEDYRGKLGPEGDHYLDSALRGATRMQRLIDDLLAYSKIDTAKFAPRPVALEETLRHALESLEVALRESQAQVTHDPLPTVPGEQSQLLQLFQNLLSNALKFRGAEPPRIHVSAQREGEAWTLAVRDNGIGIEPRYFERIFKMFERLHSESQYSGTGIGLAVCQRIAERHGGRLWVESEPGRGSTFSFTLPAELPDARGRPTPLSASGARA